MFIFNYIHAIAADSFIKLGFSIAPDSYYQELMKEVTDD